MARIRKRSRNFPISYHGPSKCYYHTKKPYGRIYLTSDADESLRRFHDNMEDIRNGKRPRWLKHKGKRKEAEPVQHHTPDQPMFLREGLELALAAREQRVTEKRAKAGRGPRKPDSQLAKACRNLVLCAGGDKPIASMTPADFARFMEWLERQQYAPETIGRAVSGVKGLFNWLSKEDYIADQPKYGSRFHKPEQFDKRLHKREKIRTHGIRYYTVPEIRALLEATSRVQSKDRPVERMLRCAVLLGVNAGFGATDLELMDLRDIDFEGRFYSSLRTKTGAVTREFELWQETADALRDFIQNERAAVDSHRVFALWNEEQISYRFRTLLKAADFEKRRGLNQYGLRHSFRTFADSSKDIDAIKTIMGQSIGRSDETYLEERFRPRLKCVTDAVYQAVFGD